MRKTDRDFFERVVALNREAFDGGRFSAAYHLLEAAVYLAEDEQSAERVRRVEQAAREQLASIDRDHPEYEHSTASSLQRGLRESVYTLLARRAHTQAMVLGHESARKKP